MLQGRRPGALKDYAERFTESSATRWSPRDFSPSTTKTKALGLCRSTTWTILKANHKSSGLSEALINRILRAPQLPPLVRSALLEYVDEKAAGL